MNEFNMMFYGFHPSKFTKSYINEKMDHLLDESPYGAMLNPTLSRHDNEFKFQISIHSAAGRFFTSASGTKMKNAVSKAITQMKRQLNKWKTQRFTHDKITKHLTNNENQSSTKLDED